jgi:TonB family protein
MDSELQRSYQPSMLLAQIAVVALAALFAIWLRSFQASPPSAHDRYARADQQLRQTAAGGPGRYDPRAQLGFTGGFLDRGRLRIVSDEAAAAPAPTLTPTSYAGRPIIGPVIPDSASRGIGTPGSVSGVTDGLGPGGDDFGLPEAPGFITIRPARIPDFPLGGQSITKRTPDRPLTISRFEAPLPPRRARHVNGTATVRLRVDGQGRVEFIVIEREDPQGLGLGPALIEALNECYYEPAIVDGRPTAMEVVVTYEFGINKAPMLHTAGNVTLLMR